MEVRKCEDSLMTGDRGEGDFALGDVDPMERPKISIFLPPSSYQTSDVDFSKQRNSFALSN
jgi:hypothetical protein